ncbi:hypothetical protein EDD16DRAFT_609032 [Pisolithus croceorrhizus]|nr:hypothetical protein EDD16DRAFT_609032 [Pisolithus croceorrhizus]
MGQCRTGTWQFISAALLRNPVGEHQLIDDIESFVHVLGWIVLCCLPSPIDVTRVVTVLYNRSFQSVTGQEQGGSTKVYKFVWDDYPLKKFTLTEHSPILELIRTLASPFYARYRKPPTEEVKRMFESLKALVLQRQLDKKLFDTLPAHRYNLGIERLSSPEWFLNTIQDALEAPGWPDRDGAEINHSASARPAGEMISLSGWQF